MTAAVQTPGRREKQRPHWASKSAVRQALEYIAGYYRVPIRIGAPVAYEGRPGKVVWAVDQYVVVRLADESGRPGRYHPRDLIWLEENGPATNVPHFGHRAVPALLLWSEEDGGGQWSGC